MSEQTSTTSTNEATSDQRTFGGYTGITIFFIITIIYFIKKPKVTPDNPEPQSYMSLALYFAAVLLTQLFWNAYILSSTCGGNFNSYLGQAALYTILPWTFFFGIVIALLISAPSFKSAFSDIVGYYLVQSQASKIFSTLLVGQGSPELEKEVLASAASSAAVEGSGSGSDTNITSKDIAKTKTYFDLSNPSKATNAAAADIISPLTMNSNYGPNMMAKQVYEIEKEKAKQRTNNSHSASNETDIVKEAAGITDASTATDLITQICGNVGVLINQLLPSNFNNFWSTFQQSNPPLFKPQFRSDNENTMSLKNSLFDLVVFRDNIGEGFWYVYTGILVSCIVQFQIASFNCKAK